ncbi:MAG: MFS transporter [Spirochaetales bacterium]|nr:MFS transporter [Spirochaetales bacterium]
MAEQQYLKRNFSLSLLDGITYFMGMIFISFENVIPVYLVQLGARPFWISLIPAIRNIAVFIPSIFIVRKIQGLNQQKGWIIKSGLFQRLPWLLSGLFCFFFASAHPRAAVFSIMLAIFLNNLGGGLSIPSFSYFTAKTIPVSLRGRLFALRNLISYFFGILCGGLITWLLTNIAFPRNYAVIILTGFGILMIYLPAFLFQVEPDARKTVDSSDESLKDFFIHLRDVLAGNRDLQNYIAGRVFYTLGFSAYTYFAVYLVDKFNLPGSSVGLFAILTAATFLLVNPVLGIVADRMGHLFNHIAASLLLAASTGIAVFSDSYIVSLSIMVLGAAMMCIQNVSFFALPMEFGEDHDIPLYSGLIGLFVGASSLLIVLFALLAEAYGYIPVFAVCFFLSFISLFFFKRTEDPRKRVAELLGDA